MHLVISRPMKTQNALFYPVALALMLSGVLAETSAFAQYANRGRPGTQQPQPSRPSRFTRGNGTQDGAFLDPPYPRNIPHGVRPANRNGFDRPFPPKSNTIATIQRQSPVKSQGARGTCSIFSATAMLEAFVAAKSGVNPAQVDLSEEWLSYSIRAEGSFASRNFQGFAQFGSPREERYSYIGEGWTSLAFNQRSQERCGKVPLELQKSCLTAHADPRLLAASVAQLQDNANPLYNPEFLKAREEAFDLRDRLRLQGLRVQIVQDEAAIKKLLAAGVPLLFEADFYYGAWNHGKADSLGIGRDMNLWAQGVVGYPERGSLDLKVSQENPAGHSVLLVGYDDNASVTTQQKMVDGTVKTFTYKGVYYFKNSWGTGSFATRMVIDGVSAPGYGAITQKYVHEIGPVYQVLFPN